MESQPVDYEEALAQFSTAVEVDENFWEAYENIGLIQLDLARYDEAIAAFESEMAVVEDLVNREWPVDPRPEIWLNIGKAYALAGRFQDAAGAFQQLLELDPENVEARANLAALNVQQGNTTQARDYISDLLEMSQNGRGSAQCAGSNLSTRGRRPDGRLPLGEVRRGRRDDARVARRRDAVRRSHRGRAVPSSSLQRRPNPSADSGTLGRSERTGHPGMGSRKPRRSRRASSAPRSATIRTTTPR